MRVLSILPFSPPSKSVGGAERQMHSLHKGLRALGIDVQVLADIAFVGAAYQEFEGVPIWGVRFPVMTAHIFRPGNIKLLKRLLGIAWFVKTRIGSFEVIQATTFRQPALVAVCLSILTDDAVIVRLACSGAYGDFTYAQNNWLFRRCLPGMIRRTDFVVALDGATRTEALSHGVPSNKIHTIQMQSSWTLYRV